VLVKMMGFTLQERRYVSNMARMLYISSSPSYQKCVRTPQCQGLKKKSLKPLNIASNHSASLGGHRNRNCRGREEPHLSSAVYIGTWHSHFNVCIDWSRNGVRALVLCVACHRGLGHELYGSSSSPRFLFTECKIVSSPGRKQPCENHL
jgi:hypothetical protein